ncbi:hypothetical protein I4U23_023025 [Adineta vaga]|nr:hypothetical protein I4U23_023025 [Adineta vaga]
MCNALKQATRQYDRTLVSVSFLSTDDATNPNLNQLHQSFMYSQILKEILIEINYDVETAIKNLIAYVLHKNIEQLHAEQRNDYEMPRITVYRGQGLSKDGFEKMMKTKGELMSFNNFLSTSIDRDVAFTFADSIHYKKEKNFSMKFLPTIFRIFNINFQPTNSEHIDMDSVQTRLYPGAHIATGNPYDYFHHGIVIDPTTDDISIVHFWGHKKREAHVQTTTLSTFISGSSTRVASKNRQLYLVHYENDTFEKQQETCQRAKDMLIETPYNYKFHLLRLNCESFARFCRTKEWKSEQKNQM